MKILTAIEFIDSAGEMDCLDIELEGYPTWDNDSYHDEHGLVQFDPTPIMDSEPTWRQKDYTHAQNLRISDYVRTHGRRVDALFCEALREEAD